MIVIIEHPKESELKYRIEYGTISSKNTFSIFREDGEGIEIDEEDLFEIIDDWFMKKWKQNISKT